MSLPELVRDARRRELTLTIYDPPDDALVADLRERLTGRRIEIRTGSAEGGPSGFAVVSRAGDVLDALDCDQLAASLADEATRALDDLLDAIDPATFTARSTAEMLAASREIEDRAWRVGAGELHAGFQRVEAIEAQSSVYRQLATSDLDVFAYAADATAAPTLDGVTVHVEDVDELRRTWFVVFDGGPNPTDCSALLAVAEDGGFSGVLTYDRDVVQSALDHLRDRYVAAE